MTRLGGYAGLAPEPLGLVVETVQGLSTGSTDTLPLRLSHKREAQAAKPDSATDSWRQSPSGRGLRSVTASPNYAAAYDNGHACEKRRHGKSVTQGSSGCGRPC